MIRNLKVLGLAMVAMLAMSAVAASSASAWFTSEQNNTILTAEATEPQVFSAPFEEHAENIEVSCEEVSVSGTSIEKEQESITATPHYTKCELVVPTTATVKAFVEFNGCDYTFTTDTEVHIKCPEGKQIEVKGEFVPPFKSKCLDIPAQTPTKPIVHYINQGSGMTRHVEIESTVEGITYEKTGICGTGLHHDADYDGKVTVTGEDDEENHVGIEWHEG